MICACVYISLLVLKTVVSPYYFNGTYDGFQYTIYLSSLDLIQQWLTREIGSLAQDKRCVMQSVEGHKAFPSSRKILLSLCSCLQGYSMAHCELKRDLLYLWNICNDIIL